MVDSKIVSATSGATKDMSLKHPKDEQGLTDKQKIFVRKPELLSYYSSTKVG